MHQSYHTNACKTGPSAVSERVTVPHEPGTRGLDSSERPVNEFLNKSLPELRSDG